MDCLLPTLVTGDAGWRVHPVHSKEQTVFHVVPQKANIVRIYLSI